MPKLLIRLRSAAIETEDGFEVRSEWLILNEDDRIRGWGQADYRGLSDIIDPASVWLQNPDNIIVTLPSDQLLSLQCIVPGRSSAQIRKALPFVVEEFLATDIERMHIVSGPILRGQPVRCHLVDRPLFESWIACLRSLGIEPGYFLAETDLLPTRASGAVVLFDDNQALVRSLDQSALVDRSNLAVALEALTPTELYLINGTLETAERERLAATLEVEQDPWPNSEKSALGYISSRIGAASTAINFLQGSYRPQRRQTSRLGRWRMGAGLAASWFVAAVVMNGVSAFYSGREADRLEAEASNLYREIFPEAKRIINPRRQMQQALGDSSGGTLGLMLSLDHIASAVPAESRIQSLDFTSEDDELAVDLIVSGYERLETIKTALSENGKAAEIVSAEQQPDGVRARVRVRGTGQGA